MSCLKLLGVHVPQSVSVGDTVTLHCDYDLQGSPLYSLKWHKDGREFFRLYRNTSPILHLTSPMPPMPPMPPFNQLPPTSGRANRRKNQKNKQHHITQQHNLYQQQIQASNNIQLTPMVGIDVDVSDLFNWKSIYLCVWWWYTSTCIFFLPFTYILLFCVHFVTFFLSFIQLLVLFVSVISFLSVIHLIHVVFNRKQAHRMDLLFYVTSHVPLQVGTIVKFPLIRHLIQRWCHNNWELIDHQDVSTHDFNLHQVSMNRWLKLFVFFSTYFNSDIDNNEYIVICNRCDDD